MSKHSFIFSQECSPSCVHIKYLCVATYTYFWDHIYILLSLLVEIIPWGMNNKHCHVRVCRTLNIICVYHRLLKCKINLNLNQLIVLGINDEMSGKPKSNQKNKDFIMKKGWGLLSLSLCYFSTINSKQHVL